MGTERALSSSGPGTYAQPMPHDAFESLDEPFEADEGPDEKAEKLLEESDGKEDPDTED
jgi:hypothetical protein